MTLTQLAVAIDAYLLLNPLQLNTTVITEGTQVYSHIATTPTFEFRSDDGVIVILRGETFGS